MNRKHLIIISILTCIYACNRSIVQTEVVSNFKIPPNFPNPTYDFADNPETQAGFMLGKKLFNDPVLSSNNTISCARCHNQTAAFSQYAHVVSDGIYNRAGTRNVPALMNLAWSKMFMRDGGIFDLDLQPIAPITNHVEMDNTMKNVLNKLKSNDEYVAMFKKAFGDEGITTNTFLKALSQFMVMCITANSKYDSVMRKQATFTHDEAKGYTIFKQKCSSCHQEPLFTDNSFHNIGLSISSVNDKGRYLVTLQDSDMYKFKTPSLRNLTFTPPYMHDGSLPTINSVLNHYTNDVENTRNLDPLLKQNNKTGIELSDDDKQNLLAFLKTLDDKNFLTDKTLSQ